MSNLQNDVINEAPPFEQKALEKGFWSYFRIPLWIYTLLALMVIWEAYARLASNTFLPPFSQVIVTLVKITLDGSLLSALFISLQALLIGFALALVVGVLLGLAMGAKPWMDRAFMIYMDILTAVPMVALIPLVVVFFGLDMTARVVIVFLFSVVIIVVNTKTGVQSVDMQLLEMAHSFGASKRQIAFRILLPTSLPYMAAGIRLALGRAIVGMVTAEMILSSVGIGNLLMQATSSFEASKVFAIVMGLLILSAVLMTLIQQLELRLLNNRR